MGIFSPPETATSRSPSAARGSISEAWEDIKKIARQLAPGEKLSHPKPSLKPSSHESLEVLLADGMEDNRVHGMKEILANGAPGDTVVRLTGGDHTYYHRFRPGIACWACTEVSTKALGSKGGTLELTATGGTAEKSSTPSGSPKCCVPSEEEWGKMFDHFIRQSHNEKRSRSADASDLSRYRFALHSDIISDRIGTLAVDSRKDLCWNAYSLLHDSSLNREAFDRGVKFEVSGPGSGGSSDEAAHLEGWIGSYEAFSNRFPTPAQMDRLSADMGHISNHKLKAATEAISNTSDRTAILPTITIIEAEEEDDKEPDWTHEPAEWV